VKLKTFDRLARRTRRTLGQLRRPLRRLGWRWRSALSRPRGDDDGPSPAVDAFLAGETVRQVAYYVGAADPGIIDPRDDWPGALADTHAVIRGYIHRLQRRIAELEIAPAAPADPSTSLWGWLRRTIFKGATNHDA
jgi:hypothetical protein